MGKYGYALFVLASLFNSCCSLVIHCPSLSLELCHILLFRCTCTNILFCLWLAPCGWASNSKYSVIGSTRCVAQSISFEVCLSILLLIWANTKSLVLFSSTVFVGLCYYAHLCFFLFVVLLAETNRSPFDFAEGESKLVSGYSVEFSGIGFTLLFLSEYLSILFISFVCGCLFSDGCFIFYFCIWGFIAFSFV